MCLQLVGIFTDKRIKYRIENQFKIVPKCWSKRKVFETIYELMIGYREFKNFQKHKKVEKRCTTTFKNTHIMIFSGIKKNKKWNIPYISKFE